MALRIARDSVIIGVHHCAPSNLHYTNIFLGALETGDLALQFNILDGLANKAHDRHIGRQVLSCLQEFRASASADLLPKLDATIALYQSHWPVAAAA